MRLARESLSLADRVQYDRMAADGVPPARENWLRYGDMDPEARERMTPEELNDFLPEALHFKAA